MVAAMPGMHPCQGFTLYCFLGIYTLGWGLFLCQFEHRQGNVCRHAYRVPTEPAAGRGTPVPRLQGRRPGAGAAVRRPSPCRLGPQAPLRVTRGGTGFQCLGFWGLILYDFRVLGFGFSGFAHARDAPMSGIYTLLFSWDLHFRLGFVSLSA